MLESEEVHNSIKKRMKTIGGFGFSTLRIQGKGGRSERSLISYFPYNKGGGVEIS